MGIQWTLVATFLYAEIAVIILLLIPGIPPKSWNKVFQSRYFKGLRAHAGSYFKVTMVALGLVFFDSLREMHKSSTQRQEAKSESHDDGNVYMQLSIQMFRAQRNVYIAGFSLFLWLVIHRLVTLIRDQASLLAVNEAAVAQARPAAEAARSPMKWDNWSMLFSISQKGSETAKQKKTVRIQTKTVEKPKEEPQAAYEKACKDVDYMTSNLDALKMHAEDLCKKYDRLFDEHAQVEQTVAAGAETKKDD
ncbi:B-cell receptor-associated protein 31-like [Haemaphysalis longicornis]